MFIDDIERLRSVDLEKLNEMVLNEAYVGKTPVLEEIVEKIHELRAKITRFNYSSTDKTVLEINRLFEKQFGMDTFALKIDGDPYINAYTTDIGRRFDMIDKDMRDYVVGNPSTGYKYIPGNGLVVIMHITVDFLTDQRFTDAEILTVLLHELGHNFAGCIYNKIRLDNRQMMIAYKKYLTAMTVMYAILACSIVGTPYGIINLIKISSLKKQYNNEILKKKEDKYQAHHRTTRVAKFLNGISASMANTKYLISAVLNRITFDKNYMDYAKSTYTKKQKESIKNSLDRRNEVIADKFPAIYGYGVDMVSLHVKFRDIVNNKEYQATEKLGKMGHTANDIYEQSMFDINDFDCHPNAVQRMHVALNTLKAELAKDDIDPKVKKEIKLQITEIEETIDSFLSLSNKVHSIEKAQALYFQWVNDNAPDAVNKEIEEDIEKQLDMALEDHERKHQ